MSEDLDCFLGNLVSYDLFKHMIDMIETMPKVTLLVRLNLKMKLFCRLFFIMIMIKSLQVWLLAVHLLPYFMELIVRDMTFIMIKEL